MKKILKLNYLLCMFLLFLTLTSCGNKLSNEEQYIYDIFVENVLPSFEDPSSARFISLEGYYEEGGYAVIRTKGANSSGITVNKTFVLFFKDFKFTSEYCEKNCSSSSKSWVDYYYKEIGSYVTIYGKEFKKGFYYDVDKIPSAYGKCTTEELVLKAILTCEPVKDIIFDISKVNKKLLQYIESMGW